MLFCFNKYFKKPSSDQIEEQKKKKKAEMIPPCTPESACTQGCCSTPFLGLTGPTNTKRRSTPATTTRASRSNFAKSSTSAVFPNTHFTNHESLPPLPDALWSFTAAYPNYSETQQADRIREHEYNHLSDHACLDYTGFSLFSHAQMHSSVPSSSSSAPSSSRLQLQPPFFAISYKSASLKSQVQYGEQQTGLESAIRRRITNFLNISEEDYSMVCTANRTAAFRLLAETYPFQSSKRLLTVYDYESEAVTSMADSAHKRGAKVMSASFSWPSLRIQSAKLSRVLINKRKKKRTRGLLVFPLQSRMTGARYPYLWMSLAQQNGWHVVLDACGLGPKDMDTLGLSLIQPDFIICSFFKVFGENPSGFAGLFIKKSSCSVLETSVLARSIGIVSIVPARSPMAEDFSGIEEEDVEETTSSFSGPIPTQTSNGSLEEHPPDSKQKQLAERFEQGETSTLHGLMIEEDFERNDLSSEIVELDRNRREVDIECRGLDHADSLGLVLIGNRLRYIANWLVIALMKLRHPHPENGHSLVRIYGPRVKFDRGPAVAFNVFDWKGEKVEPALVQKLADRSNISLSCGTLRNIWFSDKHEGDRDTAMESRVSDVIVGGKQRKESIDLGISVVNASLGFLSNFEDAYRLWAFVAKFLDADFVEKERWRYMALNQKMIEV